MRRLDVYRDWLQEYILQTTEQNALVVLPITAQAEDYREDPPEYAYTPERFPSVKAKTNIYIAHRPPLVPLMGSGLHLFFKHQKLASQV